MKLADYLSRTDTTDAAFAIAIGVDRSTVTKWKLGSTFPDFPNQMKIAKATKNKVTPNDFMPEARAEAS